MKLIKSYISSLIKIIFFVPIFFVAMHAQADIDTIKQNDYGMAFIKNILLKC